MQEPLCENLLVLWLNFIIQAVPVRLVATFAELLIGALISGSGHISDALFHVGHQKHYSTYYWFLRHGKWSWVKVNIKLIELITTCFPRPELNLILDDFICPRSSKKHRMPNTITSIHKNPIVPNIFGDSNGSL